MALTPDGDSLREQNREYIVGNGIRYSTISLQ